MFIYIPAWKIVKQNGGFENEKLGGKVWETRARFAECYTPSSKTHWYIEATVIVHKTSIVEWVTFYLQNHRSCANFESIYEKKRVIVFGDIPSTRQYTTEVLRVTIAGLSHMNVTHIYRDEAWVFRPVADVWRELYGNVQGSDITKALFL
jgi:hypothetical protein